MRLVTVQPLVLHLNGAPGVGKSTLARRWADARPGTLLLDVDVLRTWVSGWQEDFVGSGAVVRPVALAALAAYAGQGRDVVLPQLLADPAELARFREAAEGAGGRWVSVLVEASDAVARFAARAGREPHLEAVRRLGAGAGPGHLEAYAERLEALARADGSVLRLPTEDGEVAVAYERLVAAVAGVTTR